MAHIDIKIWIQSVMVINFEDVIISWMWLEDIFDLEKNVK